MVACRTGTKPRHNTYIQLNQSIMSDHMTHNVMYARALPLTSLFTYLLHILKYCKQTIIDVQMIRSPFFNA